MDLYSQLQEQKKESLVNDKAQKLLLEAEQLNDYMASESMVTFDQVKLNKNADVQYKTSEGEIVDKPVKIGLMGDTRVDRQSYLYFNKYCESFMNFLFRKKAQEDVEMNINSF